MKASTPRTSRLAAVANARRRQRKERLSVGSPMTLLATTNASGGEDAASLDGTATVGDNTNSTYSDAEAEPNNENVNQVNTIRTLPTDDESVSTWSQAQSTVSGFTDDSFGFTASPKTKMPSTITSRARAPRNISIITEEVLSPQNTSNITFRDATSPNRRTVFSPRTPKMSGARSFSSDSPTTLKNRIDELTQERDRLRMDSQLFKRKLQVALEEKSAIVHEKDNEIADLMKSIGNLTVLIDETDHDHSKALTAAENKVERNSRTIKELEQELSNTVCQLNKLRASYEMLKQANMTETSLLEQRLQTSTLTKDNIQKKLEDELSQVIADRDELESKFDECMEELGRIQGQEEKNQAIIKRQNATIESMKNQLDSREELEIKFDECVGELGRIQSENEKNEAIIKRQNTTIDSLKKQLDSSMSKANKDLSHKEQKITEILDEKFEMETALQERIYELESELKSLTNIHREDKHNHESIIKMLREQLSSANESRETTKANSIQEMNEMKKGYEESIDYLKKKVESLESQLTFANQQTESERNELTNAKSVFVTRLEECTRERNEASAKLKQIAEDFEALKTAREKDIELLETELEKAYASKLESDKQLKDTKRQLQNALHSLDEMALDGGKMRRDLEEIMNTFHTEKDTLQKELVELRHQTEDQKTTICHLNQENRRYEHDCDNLRSQIKELEAKLHTEARQHDDNTNGRDMLLLEIKYLKNMLAKTASTTSLAPPDRSTSESIAVVEQLRQEKYQIEEQNESIKRSIEQLRANEKLKSAELSKAKQTIQMLKTKEKYLESRVESLANQITKTVQEYENRLGEARELGLL